MADMSELERLGKALDRLRRAVSEHLEARRRAETRVQDLETELRQASDAMAAAHTQPDPELPIDAGAELVQTRAALTESQQMVAELRARLGASGEGADPSAGGDDNVAAQDRIAALEAALAEARTEADSLRDSVAVRDGGDRLHAMQARDTADTLQTRVSELEASMERLRQVNAQLRSNNAALRDAHRAGLADPGLINDGLEAELDALRAAQIADRAEIDSVLSALRPLLEGESINA